MGINSSDMTENELVELGFERIDIPEEESGDKAFHYYTYDFGNKSFSLITNASDEVVDGKWVIEVFEDENIRFTSVIEVKQLIRIIERNTKKK